MKAMVDAATLGADKLSRHPIRVIDFRTRNNHTLRFWAKVFQHLLWVAAGLSFGLGYLVIGKEAGVTNLEGAGICAGAGALPTYLITWPFAKLFQLAKKRRERISVGLLESQSDLNIQRVTVKQNGNERTMDLLFIKKLGEGAMGAVDLYKIVASDDADAVNSLVAMKRMTQDDPTLRKRFMQEARLLAMLDHPDIVKIIGYGELDDGVPFYLMDYLEGQELAERLKVEGCFSLPAAIKVMIPLLKAFKHIHSKKIIHRDVKPENLFWIKGRAVVVDFGISKPTDDAASAGSTKLTMIGKIVGSPPYMSPQQITGSNVDYYSDLFSLGVIFWEMLTGKVPIEFDPVADKNNLTEYLTRRLGMIITNEQPQIADTLINDMMELVALEKLQIIFNKLMAYKPAERYQNDLEERKKMMAPGPNLTMDQIRDLSEHDLIIEALEEILVVLGKETPKESPPPFTPTPNEQPMIVL